MTGLLGADIGCISGPKIPARNRVAVAISGVIATCLLLIGLQFITTYTRQHRLLRELQDEAFTNALGAAMSAQGNADTLIQRAADVGVSDDRIFMLRGQRRLYGGDPGGMWRTCSKHFGCVRA